jgi:hypothetical protein
MSDTPKTDQAKIAAGFQAVPESFLVFARKLERENAALRKIADDAIMLIEHANPDAWNNGNTHPDGFGPDEGAVMASRFYSSLLDTRAAIDAARKEAQP